MTPWPGLQQIRSRAPRVRNITNYVGMNTTADALLALGVSPVRAHALETRMDEVRFWPAMAAAGL